MFKLEIRAIQSLRGKAQVRINHLLKDLRMLTFGNQFQTKKLHKQLKEWAKISLKLSLPCHQSLEQLKVVGIGKNYNQIRHKKNPFYNICQPMEICKIKRWLKCYKEMFWIEVPKLLLKILLILKPLKAYCKKLFFFH